MQEQRLTIMGAGDTQTAARSLAGKLRVRLQTTPATDVVSGFGRTTVCGGRHPTVRLKADTTALRKTERDSLDLSVVSGFSRTTKCGGRHPTVRLKADTTAL